MTSRGHDTIEVGFELFLALRVELLLRTREEMPTTVPFDAQVEMSR